MYTDINFKTKKALKEAVKAGKRVTVYAPNGDFYLDSVHSTGEIFLEGPHYPEPHRWYASATIENGVIVKVS